jgi:predicted secreted hydrolase
MVPLATAFGTAQDDGWRRASSGRPIALPADHASHPEFKIEWWYYTGNLAAPDGRRFGYQLTFFRIGLVAAPKNPSAWTVRDLFVAHLAVTDVARGRHRASEVMSRAGIGWAGARTDIYRVWNGSWSARLDQGVHRLQAVDAARGFGLDLALREGKPAAPNGEHGFSQKGSVPGNATYYYSLTRMPTSGALILDGERVAVEGDSWMDHEFGTSVLERGQAGWDWFSLQLGDDTELMVYRLRRDEGTTDPHSSGTLVDAGGHSRTVQASAFTLEPGRIWKSPATGGAYPVEWSIRVPSEQLELAVRPLIDAQEMAGFASGVAYWEGAIEASGTRAGRPLTGRGYLELTGYGGRPIGEALESGARVP